MTRLQMLAECAMMDGTKTPTKQRQSAVFVCRKTTAYLRTGTKPGTVEVSLSRCDPRLTTSLVGTQPYRALCIGETEIFQWVSDIPAPVLYAVRSSHGLNHLHCVATANDPRKKPAQDEPIRLAYVSAKCLSRSAAIGARFAALPEHYTLTTSSQLKTAAQIAIATCN